jgi:serine/threonine-protein kinase
VYVARDEELGRRVALKEIRDDKAADMDLRSRFVLEAEINGNLEHPGIVPVYGLGSYADGRPFYAMRFVEGDSLKEAVERFHKESPSLDSTGRSLRLRQLLGRFVDVCEAIAYAHSRGVLHRDLKPANVMLGQYGETLVVDWGLAKATGRRDPGVPEGAAEATLVPPGGHSHDPTLAGIAFGTPQYMSPEQAEGRLDRLGPATDVYGLGATLYALLTGRAPVSGSTIEETLAAVRQGAIDPPRRMRPGIPRPLEAVCLKALALRPEDRYPSARALADDVERWLADEAVSARRDPPLTRAWRWVRKHRTLATTAAAAVLVGLLALAVAYRREARYAADLRRSDAETDRWLNRAMDSMEDYYSGFSEEALGGGKLPPALRDRLLEKPRGFYEALAAEIVARPNPSERERSLLARGRYSLAHILDILGRDDQAREQYEAAVATYEALAARRPDAGPYRHGLASSHANLGLLLVTTGRGDEAAEAFRKAAAIHESLVLGYPDVPSYREGLARSHIGLGNLLIDRGRFQEAAEVQRKTSADLGDLADRHPDVPQYRDLLARSQSNLGVALEKTGRQDEAVEAYRKAVAIREALAARYPDVPSYQDGLAVSHNGLGLVLANTHRAVEAAEAHRRAIAVYQALVARLPDVPSYQYGLARSHTGLGIVLRADGRPDEAAEAYRKAIAGFGDLAARHPDVPDYQDWLANGHTNLGRVLRATGRPGEAVEAYRKSIAIHEALVARHPGVPGYRDGLANTTSNLGNVLRATGRPAEAAEAHRTAIRLREALVALHPDVPGYKSGLANSHMNLGVLLATTGRWDEAAEADRRAIAAFGDLADRHPDVAHYQDSLANSQNNLAGVLSELGRLEEAAEAARMAIAIRENLLARHPQRPDYLSDLGDALQSLGRVLATQGRHEEAVGRYRVAIGHQRAAFERLPQVTEYRRSLGEHYLDLVASLGILGRGGEVADVIRDLVDLWPGNPGQLYQASRTLFRYFPLARDADQRRALADAAMTLLGAAADAGWSDAARTAADPDLAPLRDRPDFQALVAAMWDRAMPADPFAGSSGEVRTKEPVRR